MTLGRPRIQRILAQVRAALQPGARLLIVDQWMNDTHSQPAFGAMLAGTYLLLSGDGDTYSVSEVKPWLEGAGFAFVEHRALAGATSLVIATAV